MSSQQALKEYSEAREKMDRIRLMPGDQMLLLDEALECLPNVTVATARKFLHRLVEDLYQEFSDAIMSDRNSDHLDLHKKLAPNVIVTLAASEDLFRKVDRKARVTPNGARLLLRMYEADLLPKSRKPREGDLDRLKAYAAFDEAEICEQIKLAEEERLRKSEEDRAARLLVLDSPERIPESDFSYRLLNDVFIRHKGLGFGTAVMSIGGIDITKSVAVFSSNSRKSRDSSVRFTWKDSSGAERVIEKPSRFEGNRGNDAGRNWGMSRRE